jgi:type IV secretion system protein VirB5
MKPSIAIVCVLLAVTSLQTKAQLAVIDSANVAQAAKQVRAWADQYQQMRSQIDAMNSQLRALTGDRGMATLLPTLVPFMPADWTQAMTDLSVLAKQIRESQAILTPAQAAYISPQLQQFLAQAQSQSAANQAMAQVAFNDAAARQARLQTLIARLATTDDPKSAYDLANLVAIEHAGLIKDQNQLEAAANGAAAQERAQQLMINQLRVTNAGSAIPIIDTSLP